MDSDLLRQAKAGDSAALNSVWRWCAAELRALYRARVSRETAAVLVQRTAVDLVKKFDQAPDEPGEFRSWVRGFGRKIELRWRREVARYGEVLADFEHQGCLPVRGLESEFGAEEEHALMYSAIEKLPSPYRSTLRLHNAQLDARQIAALRSRPAMPLPQLIHLVSRGRYADDLRELRVDELNRGPKPLLAGAPGETIEHTVMRVFRAAEDQWFSAGFFVRYLGLKRWTAQKICGELADKDLLERRGRTSGTRYRFVARSS